MFKQKVIKEFLALNPDFYYSKTHNAFIRPDKNLRGYTILNIISAAILLGY